MTKEEFERAFPDEEPPPKYNQSGQEVCFDCESTQIMGLHRCVSCYYRYTEERRYSNPKNYYKCRSCKTPNAFHQGKNSSECKNCRQNALNELRFSHKRLVNQNTSSQQQHLNQSPSLEELYEEPLVVSKKEDCNKFRVGWARIRRQIIMRRFHLKIAEEIREQRRHERQKRREERRNLIQPNRSSSFDRQCYKDKIIDLVRIHVVVPSNPANWIPEGWRKGQFKVCRVKLNGSIRDYCCPNFCRTCGNRYLRQRVCIACKETKRHHGKGLCKPCYNNVRSGRVQNPNVQTKKANGEGHSISMQAKRVKGEEVSQMNENFLANNEHNQMGVNTMVVNRFIERPIAIISDQAIISGGYIIINATFGFGYDLIIYVIHPYPLLPYPIVILHGLAGIPFPYLKDPQFLIYVGINIAVMCMIGLVNSTTLMFLFRYLQTTQSPYLKYMSDMRICFLVYIFIFGVNGVLVFLPLNWQLLSNEALKAGIKPISSPKTRFAVRKNCKFVPFSH
ncbi:hypothetical protein M3Y97_00676800 [Aphelenchoides bicaudatus]|nr:hypothetical protein M3Y97_00676800 [Aphelenchoides bicaudatus]